MSVEVIPMEMPLTVIVEGSDTHFIFGWFFRREAVAPSMIGKGGWVKKI